MVEKNPSTRQEKDEFKKFTLKHIKSPTETNFDEAYKQAFKAYMPTEIPSELKQILSDPKADNPTSPFWFMVHGLKAFIANEGKGYLPVTGSLPDFTATTQGYIDFGKLYSNRAASDLGFFFKSCQNCT